MTTAIRTFDPTNALVVEGRLPDDLRGSFLQAGPSPHTRFGDGPHLFCGVLLENGTARRHREAMPVRRDVPLGPVPSLAPSIWPAAPDVPDCPGSAAIARPVCEAGTGEWHTVATYPGLGHAEHLVAAADGTVLRAEPFALDGAPFMEAVAVTRRFLVVLDLPYVYSRAADLIGARLPYTWREDRAARVGLLPREGGEPRWFDVDPCYVPRVVNAFEDGDTVVLEAFRRSTGLYRWTFDQGSGAVSGSPVQIPSETVIVDERVTGRRHRYLFGCLDGAALIRHDLANGSSRTSQAMPGRRASALVFAPDPRSDAEGTGWLLALVRDSARGSCELGVHDALDLSLVAVVHLPLPPPTARRAAWRHWVR